MDGGKLLADEIAYLRACVRIFVLDKQQLAHFGQRKAQLAGASDEVQVAPPSCTA